jgi:hypothetical protein
MRFRIYADEAGTHGGDWLVIGMLFVPDHGSLHSALCEVKERNAYFNNSPKRSNRYKEIHLADFKSSRDVAVGKEWLVQFLRHSCYYRSIVVDWSIWDGSYFGNPFDAEALKKRRAYKKWAEMLLNPELRSPCDGRQIYHAHFYLDRLRAIANYDVLQYLEERFSRNYAGESPYIDQYQHTDSWRDANQCLQLCDLLTGCVYQSLVPSEKAEKRQMRSYLEDMLKPLGVKRMVPGFWRQYAKETLTKHFPKFSAWFWRPSEKKERDRRRRQ